MKLKFIRITKSGFVPICRVDPNNPRRLIIDLNNPDVGHFDNPNDAQFVA